MTIVGMFKQHIAVSKNCYSLLILYFTHMSLSHSACYGSLSTLFSWAVTCLCIFRDASRLYSSEIENWLSYIWIFGYQEYTNFSLYLCLWIKCAVSHKNINWFNNKNLIISLIHEPRSLKVVRVTKISLAHLKLH